MYRVTNSRYIYLNDFNHMMGIFKPEYKSHEDIYALNAYFINRCFFEEFKDYVVFDGKRYQLILSLEERLNHFFSSTRSHKNLVIGRIEIGQQTYFVQCQTMSEDLYCISFFKESQIMLQPGSLLPLNGYSESSGNLAWDFAANSWREKAMMLELQNQELRHTAKAKAGYTIDLYNHFCAVLKTLSSAVQSMEDGEAKELSLRYIEELKTITEFVSSMAMYNTKADGANQKVLDLKHVSDSIWHYLAGLCSQYTVKYEYVIDNTAVIGDESRLLIILRSIADCLPYVAEEKEIRWRIEESQLSEMETEIKFQLSYKGKNIERLIAHHESPASDEKMEQPFMALKLAIIKQLASVMGGKLTVTDEEQAFNAFTLKWKFRKQREDSQLLQNVPDKEEKIILYVDDHLSSQDIMEKLIKRRGHNYIAAYSAQEAIDILKTQKVDLVFMDIYMPQTNGHEATRIIRENHFSLEELPIIGMTAYTMNNSREECLKAGMNDYMEKPFEIDHLYKMIDKYLFDELGH